MAASFQQSRANRTRPDPIRIALAGNYNNRDSAGSKDFRFINTITEVIDNQLTQTRRIYSVKRPGYIDYSRPPGANATARGWFYWARTGKVYSVFGNKLYADTVEIQTLATSSGMCGFAETDGATKYLVVVDGTDGYYITTSDVVTEIADVDFPTPHIPMIENVDGYLFLIKSSSNEIYNSNTDDPTAWVATNFFQAEMYPDSSIALSRYRNLLVVLGNDTVEFFYDAANEAGSPLSRVEQMTQSVGCAEARTVQRIGDTMLFVAQTKSGRFVAKLEGDKLIPISTNAMNRVLTEEGTSISSAESGITYLKGHPVYILNLAGADRSFVYDVDNEQWTEFSSESGGSQVRFVGSYFGDRAGRSLFQHRTDGNIYEFDADTYQDDGTTITVTWLTSVIDADTSKRKFLHRLDVVGDRDSSSHNLSISWTDDDYQNFSTARTVDMSQHMFLRNCGNFRRRAFKLVHASNRPIRLEALELEYSIGAW